MKEISPRYNPVDVEDKWYSYWLENNIFHAEVDSTKKPFTIVIPPPNVTGILHMGHALNNTIQDILFRYHHMKGDNTLWMPGTDHAGIATQNVVERSIAKEGLKRQDLGREKFLERVWQWREQYGSTIISQLKKLGASCDWQRTRFTMDEEYSKAVNEVFVKLWNDGLIYQGDYIINWCPRCLTALADEEAPHQDLDGKLYYIRYPFKDKSILLNKKNYIVVATTRPETMLGDTAVAVNPKDKRFKKIVGETVVLPLMNREIKIITDDLIDTKFGTGLVKVTPAHDPNDYQMGMRHKLEFINIMHPNAVLNENAGAYKDKDRFDARKLVLEDLEKQGLIEKIEPHQHAVGHCYRCHTVIEPYLSRQWFVKMKPLAKEALEVVKKGKIKFHPRRWTKVYVNWMENIQDWCISRQIWWGHRLPVYYCPKCKETGSLNSKLKSQKSKIDEGIFVSHTKLEKCPVCGSNEIHQDEDVLDTWFSSWLWPFATFGWPFSSGDRGQKTENRGLKENKNLSSGVCHPAFDLDYFYPTNVLVTAQEIIFFWVARMIMSGLYFMKNIPFSDVYIHGTVRDIEGKKMSKSLGNVIDPLEIIKEYGCDALRFSLVSLTSTGQDVFLSKEKFEKGRNFANKIWNASRFILMNLKEENIIHDAKFLVERAKHGTLPERWIISDFYETCAKLDKALDAFRFNEAVNLLYEFFWHQFCDWYVEIAKLTIDDKNTQSILYHILEQSLRMLHPFMPFITEEIWQSLPKAGTSISVASWPTFEKKGISKTAAAEMQTLINMIVAIRTLRTELQIPPKEQVGVQVICPSASKKSTINDNSAMIERLAQAKGINFIAGQEERAKGVSAVIATDLSLNIPLEGIIDIQKEKERVASQIAEAQKFLSQKESRLNNKAFVEKAPAEVVAQEKEKAQELRERIKKLEELANALR